MKKLLVFLTLSAGSLMAMSAPLSPEDALSRLRSSAFKMPGVEMKLESTPAYSYVSSQGNQVAYVFNKTNDGGYIILSADDVAYPVLGYADNGAFSEDEMAPALRWWLSEYGRQIEFAKSKNAAPARKLPSSYNEDWEAVAPMVTTMWNQDQPYNNDCPILNNELCVTGCVATSMAQLMNYFKYPEAGEGSISYKPSTMNRTLKMTFDKQSFDWDNMRDYYARGNYTEEEAAAVAYLMKACGYSTQMQYSPEMSGTQGELIARALKTYFKYDGNCRSEQRLPYSWNEWSSMIYDNLKNIGPIVMNGSSMYGGHSFICDGYDGNGYFHFNWGWGGVSDGYYALDALNPDAQGIGGYAGGYNFNQDVILGAQKPTGEPVAVRPSRLTQYGASIGEIDGNLLKMSVHGSSMLGWGDSSENDIKVKLGINIESIDGEFDEVIEGKLGHSTLLNLSPGTYIPPINGKPTFELPKLSDGRYKVTLCSLDLDMEDSGWLPVIVEWSLPNYVYLNVSSGVFSVENVEIPRISVASPEIKSEVYMQCNFKMVAEVSNNSDMELTQGVSPVLISNGEIVAMGQSILVTLTPGETRSYDWLSKFDRLSTGTLTKATEFEWGLINPQTNYMYGTFGKVTVNPTPGNLRVAMSSIAIKDTPTEAMTIDDMYLAKVFTVDNLEDFTFDLKFKVNSGYFDGQLLIGLCEVDVQGQFDYSMIPIGDPAYQEYVFLSMGQSFEHQQSLCIPNGIEDKLYAVRVQYTAGMGINLLGSVYVMKKADNNSVESVTDNFGSVEYYNLQGIKVENPTKGQIVIEKTVDSARKIIVK